MCAKDSGPAKGVLFRMLMILLTTAGFLAALTVVAVYSALVLAHRTDELVAGMCDDSQFGAGPIPGHA